MKTIIITIAIFLSAAVSNAEIITLDLVNVSPSHQAGHTVSGTIQIDTSLGVQYGPDLSLPFWSIVAFDYKVRGPIANVDRSLLLGDWWEYGVKRIGSSTTLRLLSSGELALQPNNGIKLGKFGGGFDPHGLEYYYGSSIDRTQGRWNGTPWAWSTYSSNILPKAAAYGTGPWGVIATPQAVPEPSSMAMLPAACIAGLCVLRAKGKL